MLEFGLTCEIIAVRKVTVKSATRTQLQPIDNTDGELSLCLQNPHVQCVRLETEPPSTNIPTSGYVSSSCATGHKHIRPRGGLEGASCNRQRLLSRAKLRLHRIFSVIILLFIVCWLPYWTYYILLCLRSIGRLSSSGLAAKLLSNSAVRTFVHCVTALNSVLNPALYRHFHGGVIPSPWLRCLRLWRRLRLLPSSHLQPRTRITTNAATAAAAASAQISVTSTATGHAVAFDDEESTWRYHSVR